MPAKRSKIQILTVLVALGVIFCPADGFARRLETSSAAPKVPERSTPVLEGGDVATGYRTMVVTAHPDATRVGMDILSRGGTAADAAVAVQMVLGLVEPQSSGIGGGGFALYYDAKTKNLTSYDGREISPGDAGQYLFRGEDGKPMEFYEAAIGGRAVGVPGTLRLLEMMHRAHGVLDWRDLMTPAIALAENGFIVTPRLAASVEMNDLKLKNFLDSKLYFFPDVINPIQSGDLLKNERYAKTLRTVALKGAAGFYTGDIAERIVKAVREDENAGLMSLEDLSGYRAIERKPVCGGYRGYKVCSMGEPSSGGLTLLNALGILQQFNLAALGPNNPVSWHLISESSRLAFADRNQYMADPSYVLSPGLRLLDPDYLKQRADLISMAHANQNISYGTPQGWNIRPQTSPEPVYPKPPGTTHFTVVDAWGNVVSMTDSVEDAFGSRMMVDGFMLNNQLTDFSFMPEKDGKLVANRVEGGKRPRSSMTPVIVFDPQGRPKIIIGSAGGSAIIGYVLQRIVSIIDWNMDVKVAISAPNIINRGDGIEMEAGAAYDLEDKLRALGHPVSVEDLNSGLTAIVIAPDGKMIGYADPRREGTAMGY